MIVIKYCLFIVIFSFNIEKPIFPLLRICIYLYRFYCIALPSFLCGIMVNWILKIHIAKTLGILWYWYFLISISKIPTFKNTINTFLNKKQLTINPIRGRLKKVQKQAGGSIWPPSYIWVTVAKTIYAINMYFFVGQPDKFYIRYI